MIAGKIALMIVAQSIIAVLIVIANVTTRTTESVRKGFAWVFS